MPELKKFTVTTTARALIRETWTVEARDEEHAKAIVIDGEIAPGIMNPEGDEVLGDEEDRAFEAIELIHDSGQAIRAILSILGNVDHSKGGGANSARMYGGMLESIREIATGAL